MPIACPSSWHPSVRMFSCFRMVVKCVSIFFWCVGVYVSGPVNSCVFCGFSLMPIGCPSSSNLLMNHSTSCRGINRFVSSMKEHVWGGGIGQSVFCRSCSSWLIVCSSNDRTMAAKLPLSGHPCANPSCCSKCRYLPVSVLYQQRFGSWHIWSKYGTICCSSGVARSRMRHASLLISLNMFVMSRSSRTRVAGRWCRCGSAINIWYWAWVLCVMNSSPPLTAMPYCPSGAFSRARSSRWCSSMTALLTRRSAVPMDMGRFFDRSLASLCSAVKYWELKLSVVVGDSWLDVVRVRILMNVSR